MYIRLEIHSKTHVSFGSISFRHKDFILGVSEKYLYATKREDVTSPPFQATRWRSGFKSS